MYYYGSKLYLPRPSILRHSLKSRRQSPSIDLELVKDVLAEYGLELTGDPRLPAGGGGRSQSLVVSTTGGKKMFKKYKHTVIRPAITCEHSILTHLAGIDFPAPRLVVTTTGETWVRRNEDNYALFDFIEGGFQYHKYVLLPGQARQFITIAGEILAMLHDKLRDFVPQGYNQNGFKSRTEGRWRDLEWFLSKLTHCVEKTPRLSLAKNSEPLNLLLQRANYLEKTLIELDALLQEANPPHWVIHGDYGPYNLLFRKNAPVVVLDFEIARLDWRFIDLADALWRFCDNRWLGFRLNKMKWLMDAYQNHLPLTETEWQLLPIVWKFLHTRRCIMHWDHYCHTQADFRLANAHQHLDLVDWMVANQDQLIATLSSKNI